jgi:hypothetical protein
MDDPVGAEVSDFQHGIKIDDVRNASS